MFSFPQDEQEAKKLYRAWCMQHHPDRGGNTETMQALNEAWNKYCQGAGQTQQETQDFTKAFEAAIRAATKENVIIELCGNWLWASGNTKEHKEALKNAGWKWASKKAMWYYHEEERTFGRKKTFEMDHIRNKYGSSRIVGKQYSAIQ
jgi:hypothetical protein